MGTDDDDDDDDDEDMKSRTVTLFVSSTDG